MERRKTQYQVGEAVGQYQVGEAKIRETDV